MKPNFENSKLYMVKPKIIDDFLSEDTFKELESKILNDKFPWVHAEKANIMSDDEHSFQFMHHLVHKRNLIYPEAKDIVDPIMNKYIETTGKTVQVTRGKVNLFIRTKPALEMGWHSDIDDRNDNYTIILYLETSDGYTAFSRHSNDGSTGRRIESIRNRAAIFPASKVHQTVTQTNCLYRRNINLNFEVINERT